MDYDDYDSEDSDEWQIQHEPNGKQGYRSYLGCQNNQSYYSEKNNSQLGYMSYSQSSESYYSERNNSQDGYKLACSDNQDITSYSPEKNKSPQGCKEQPPCIQDTYSSSEGSQGYYYNINVEYNQHGGYEYGFNHYDYLPNYGDENYDDQTYFNGYKEPFCGSSSQQKPICHSTSSHVSKKLHKNSGIIHVKPNFGSNMYNVDAIHEERAKTQRRTEKLEVMIKIHGALTQLTEQWKIRQKELKELQKEFKEFRKEEDKARQKHHRKRKENKIRINSLSIGSESQIFPILDEKMEKTLVIQEPKSDEVSPSSESPIPLVVEKQEIVECLVIQEGKCDENPRGEDPQITFYEDQNMVEIENSMIDMIMGDKANLSRPPTTMLESKAMIGQNITILGGQENSSYLEPNEQENSTTLLAKSLHGLQKHEIHVENAKKSRLGVKHGWPPPMVQGLSALF